MNIGRAAGAGMVAVVAVALALGLTTGIGPETPLDPDEDRSGPTAAADDRAPVTLEVGADRPHRTIGSALAEAARANRRGAPVTVEIAAGTYREALDLGIEDGASDAPLELVGEDGAVVTGADRVTDWETIEPGIHAHAWDEAWGLSEVPDAWMSSYARQQLEQNPVIRRRELVVVDGEVAVQHMSADAMRADPGSFYVDDDAGRILLHLPADRDIATTEVEVAVRDELLTIAARRAVTVRGLDLRHAASGVQGAAVVVTGSEDVRLTDLDVSWNNWAGVSLYRSAGVTLQRVTADHNGIAGVTGAELDRLLVEDVSASSNGWRGARGLDAIETSGPVDPSFVDFVGGQKFLFLRDAVFRRFVATDNLASGLWLDFDNVDVRIEDSVLSDNLTWGLFVEASQGPVGIHDSRLCGNETGLLIANSSGGTVTDSVIGDNDLAQLYVSGSETRHVTDRKTGESLQVAAERWAIRTTAIEVGSDQLAAATTLDRKPWRAFVSSLELSGNDWRLPEDDRVFALPGGDVVGLGAWAPDVTSSPVPDDRTCEQEEP